VTIPPDAAELLKVVLLLAVIAVLGAADLLLHARRVKR
jgi:hypothetical protein